MTQPDPSTWRVECEGTADLDDAEWLRHVVAGLLADGVSFIVGGPEPCLRVCYIERAADSSIPGCYTVPLRECVMTRDATVVRRLLEAGRWPLKVAQ